VVTEDEEETRKGTKEMNRRWIAPIVCRLVARAELGGEGPGVEIIDALLALMVDAIFVCSRRNVVRRF
jgi:hypothetical protein